VLHPLPRLHDPHDRCLDLVLAVFVHLGPRLLSLWLALALENTWDGERLTKEGSTLVKL
jgi:hypothetical protein